MRLIAFISTLLSYFLSFQKAPIEGHWRRDDLALASMNSNEQPNDLIIKPDSTYKIVGETSFPESNIPGWHSGETREGMWTVSGKKLSFWIEAQGFKFPVVHKVLKLSKDELILSPVKKVKHKYRRIRSFS